MSLAGTGIRTAGISRQQCRDQSSLNGLGTEKRYTEFDVRESLVNIYMRQTEGVRRAIAQAKLEDPLSIFSLGRYQIAQEVMDHWDWYLSCLCGTQQEYRTAFDAVASMLLAGRRRALAVLTFKAR